MLRPALPSVVMLLCASLLAAAPKESAPAKAKPAAPAPKPAPKTPEPEYMGIVFRVDPSDKTQLQSLERQTYAINSKVKGLGFGGSKAFYEVPGTTSTTRFTAGEPMVFVIRASSKDVDPSSLLRLVPLNAATAGKKQAKQGSTGTRQATWMDQKGAFGDVKVDPTLGAIPILAKTYGEASIEFKPETDLGPGEYAILLQSSMTAFCFAVDPAAAK